MKKKRIKLGRFQLNLSDRTSYTLIALFAIIILGVGVYAFGTPNPTVFGHSLGELDWSSVIPQIKTNSLCLGSDCRGSWPANDVSCPSGYSFITYGDQAICTKTDWEVTCTCWANYGQDNWLGGGVTCFAKRDANGLLWVKTDGSSRVSSGGDFYYSCSSGWINGVFSSCISDENYRPMTHSCSILENPMRLHGLAVDSNNYQVCECTKNV